MSLWGWSGNSYTPPYWTNVSSSNATTFYPAVVQLPSVLDDERELSDREWLTAQVEEVVALAA